MKPRRDGHRAGVPFFLPTTQAGPSLPGFVLSPEVASRTYRDDKGRAENRSHRERLRRYSPPISENQTCGTEYYPGADSAAYDRDRFESRNVCVAPPADEADSWCFEGGFES
jgi:hypothetical protein